MSHIALFNNNGELIQSIRCPSEDLVHYSNYIFLSDNELFVQDEFYIPDIQHPVKTALPARPSDYHVFDYVSKTWAISNTEIDIAKANKKVIINDKVSELRYASISYDSKNLDANELAQTNISGKIVQIQNEIALSIVSGDLFWKDADNVIHTWISVNVYLEWLQGLQIAIANRTSTLYQTAWAGKAEVDLLTNIQAVIDYDVNTLFGI